MSPTSGWYGVRASQWQRRSPLASAGEPGRLTQIGARLGTPDYMAPEQWEGADVTAQADIYAFGCILGEMVTGRMLVRGSLAGSCGGRTRPAPAWSSPAGMRQRCSMSSSPAA